MISIHAAREGGDTLSNAGVRLPRQFQSTPPVKAATAPDAFDVVVVDISIHAAREGGDDLLIVKIRACNDFNPRRP